MTIYTDADTGKEMPPERSGVCDEALKALANPVRRQILAWLKAPESHFSAQEHPLSFGVCAGQITAHAGLSQSTTSAHLAILQQAGLVTARRVGQWIFFKRNEDAIKTLLARLGAEL
jgi:DNA-binding transcriptional ArsR family regulator